MVLMEDDGDTLTEEETLATVFLMYLAGHVTTVNLVGNGVVALLTHPEQLAKLKADPGLAKNMVEETLRYWGPVDFIGRRMATEDMASRTRRSQGGAGRGQSGQANRDPERLPIRTPSTSAGRTPTGTSPSARGIHVCLGAPLARVEGQVAFETLIRRYPELRLAVPEDEVVWSGNFLRGFRQVPLLF